MRSLPNASEPMNEAIPQKVRVPWYAWFDELWRKLRGIWNANEGDVLVIVNGKVVGTAPTTYEFPEAPQDGAIYGRKNAAWTQVITGTSGGSPGAPRYSVQYNDPLGTFAGTAEYTVDLANTTLYLGLADDWTIKPNNNATVGVDLTIQAGKNTGSGSGFVGGDLYLKGGEATSGGTAELGGIVSIQTTTGPYGTGHIEVVTGTCTGSGYNTGSFDVTTGAVSGVGGISGQILMTTGASTGFTASGPAALRSGDGANGSGHVSLVTGDATGGSSGDILLTTGDGGGASGDIILTLGSGVPNIGHIKFVFQPTSTLQIDGDPGSDGDVLLSAGSGAPPVWGQVASEAGGSAFGAPYYIPVGDTYTVQENFQVLFNLPITVDGTLEVFGYLVEMA